MHCAAQGFDLLSKTNRGSKVEANYASLPSSDSSTYPDIHPLTCVSLGAHYINLDYQLQVLQCKTRSWWCNSSPSLNPGMGGRTVNRLSEVETSLSIFYPGLEPTVALSKEVTTSALLTHWGLAFPSNNHTVVHWPGTQWRQKRLKINTMQFSI